MTNRIKSKILLWLDVEIIGNLIMGKVYRIRTPDVKVFSVAVDIKGMRMAKRIQFEYCLAKSQTVESGIKKLF